MSILEMFLQPGGCVAYNWFFYAGECKALFIGFGSVGRSRGMRIPDTSITQKVLFIYIVSLSLSVVEPSPDRPLYISLLK